MAFVVKIDEEMTLRPEVEPDLDQMVQRVRNLFKFKKFFNFNPEQILSITKAIIELIDPSGSTNFVEKNEKK